MTYRSAYIVIIALCLCILSCGVPTPPATIITPQPSTAPVPPQVGWLGKIAESKSGEVIRQWYYMGNCLGRKCEK